MATFCLIHGHWHDGSCWASVAAKLRSRGHHVATPDMPFDRPHTYRERAQPASDAVAHVQPPVVVVGHSVASAEAALVAAEHDARLLVHLCPRMGEYAVPDGAPDVFRPSFRFPPRQDDGSLIWDPDDAIREMYPRLDPPAAREAARRLHPSTSPLDPYPLSAPPEVPTALIYTTDDEFFPPEWERFIAREVLHVEPIEIPGGHFPMLEDPAALAMLLDRLAGARP
ncbi:MAG TPA: alpha/beta hydrolase [Gaiellales bacterium]|nr:alpha/beta hydrolase [Gaiellales bacterium]